jgi:hypothetical protein
VPTGQIPSEPGSTAECAWSIAVNQDKNTTWGCHGRQNILEAHQVLLSFISLSIFLRHLVHFIRTLTEFGEEHQKLLSDSGFPDAFICQPVVIKAMWDATQDRH